jgi:ATP-dependent helicase/nuclease subunit A
MKSGRPLKPSRTCCVWRLASLWLAFQEGGEVDFIEIAARASLALGDDEAPTDLAQALDYRISHLLVDEFQDTSPVQVELLEQLTRGWLPDDGRTLFVVGDPMQSIYRFRKADVGLFLRVRQRGIGGIDPRKPAPLSQQPLLSGDSGLG